MKTLGVALGVAFAFLIPYQFYFRFRFIFATVLLLLVFRLAWRERWLEKPGLRLSRPQLLGSLFVGVILYRVGAHGIPYQIEKSGGHFAYWPRIISRVSPFFQALNEEMVLRALLLAAVIKVLKNKFMTSILVAAAFGGLHWIFYHYNDDAPVNLQAAVLINLTIFGFICNELYLKFRHIGYGLAIHAGWNLTRFAGSYKNGAGVIPEGQTFNIIEGSPQLTWGLVAAVAILFLAERFTRRDSPRPPAA